MVGKLIKVVLVLALLVGLVFTTQTVVASPGIDIGADAIDRANEAPFASYTYIDKENPANASGIITTVEIWAAVGLVNCVVGTFYTTNGNTLKCRDSEAIGSVATGAKRTFLVTIAVEAGDYIGCYYTAGTIDLDFTGYAGLWYKEGQYIDPGDEATYTFLAAYAISLYGTDTTAAPDITNLPIELDFGIVGVSSTSETGLTHFSVTNNSGAPVTITIRATDFAGGNGWTLSDTATPGVDTVGLKAGLEGSDYTIIVKKTETFNVLVSGLADGVTQKWGLKLYTATEHSDGVEKSTTVTLTAVLD